MSDEPPYDMAAIDLALSLQDSMRAPEEPWCCCCERVQRTNELKGYKHTLTGEWCCSKGCLYSRVAADTPCRRAQRTGSPCFRCQRCMAIRIEELTLRVAALEAKR